jgi:hypothetical protein
MAHTVRFLACALLLVPAIGLAQVYRWVDENGRVNFGDNPPEGVDAQLVDLPKGPSEAEVREAQEALQQTLDARRAADAAAREAAPGAETAPADIPPVPPDLACYTPIEEALRGPTRQAYEPIAPTALSADLQTRISDLLAAAKGRWRGVINELVCFGNLDNVRANTLLFEADTTATWDARQAQFILETNADGSDRGVEYIDHFLEVGDALYFNERRGSGRGATPTIALAGNAVEGLFLGDGELAFMFKQRSFQSGGSIVRTSVLHLKVGARTLELTELYFHNNILTGSRHWTLQR